MSGAGGCQWPRLCENTSAAWSVSNVRAQDNAMEAPRGWMSAPAVFAWINVLSIFAEHVFSHSLGQLEP
jgi:hypothetical protein